MKEKRKKITLTARILIGLVTGILAGFLLQGAPEFANTFLKPIGTLFLNLIKMVIVPLVFSSLVMGICSSDDIKKVGRIGVKTIIYFMVTTLLAVCVGLLFGKLFNVGAGFSIPMDAAYEAKEAPSFVQTILDMFPTNPFKALSDGNMLQVIVVALFLGTGMSLAGDGAAPFKSAMDSFSQVMCKITAIIMELAPIAIFAQMAVVVSTNGMSVLLPLAGLILAVYAACIVHAVVVYSTAIKLFAKVSPIEFFKAMIPAISFAYTTASSAATLPFSNECCEKMGVSNTVRSFVLPLGATINMDGTAVFQGICALFIATVYGVQLTPMQLVVIVFSATLASIGTAGVPGAGTIMLGMVLASVNLPLEGITLILGVERILDMARTVVNITGDCACSVIVAASEGELIRPQAKTKA
ncbi:MAG: dicarboxylate/amino acid:cation symporter [Oscillospiraceae bacterium]